MVKASQTKKNGKKSKPSGATEIKAALIAAADQLIGKKGPAAVSVRDIAAAAGLMPTLVHRYFGSKDELIREVLRMHIATFREAAGEASEPRRVVDSMFDVMANNPAFLRVIAYILLEGQHPEEYLSKKGMVALLVEALSPTHGKDAQLEAAILVSQMAGFLLLEPFLLFASDYKGTLEVARAAALKRVTDALPPGRS